MIESPDRWSPFDEEATQLAMEDLGNYDAFVMGRVTYERFPANWAAVSGNPYIDRINAMPKYVASRSLAEVTWNATLLGPDIVGAIERLKAQPGKDLIKDGTSSLDATLLRAHLVDELRLWVMPVVVGTGQRLFEGVDSASLDLTLSDVRRLANNSATSPTCPAERRSGAVAAGDERAAIGGRPHRSRRASHCSRPACRRAKSLAGPRAARSGDGLSDRGRVIDDPRRGSRHGFPTLTGFV